MPPYASKRRAKRLKTIRLSFQPFLELLDESCSFSEGNGGGVAWGVVVLRFDWNMGAFFC